MKNSTPGSFLKASVFIFIAINLAVLVVYFFTRLATEHIISFYTASFLSLLNFTAGFLLLRYSIEKSTEIFMISLFGGMIVRMMVMLGLVIICLKFLELKANSFIFSILFFYVFFIIIEIIYLNLRKNR